MLLINFNIINRFFWRWINSKVPNFLCIKNSDSTQFVTARPSSLLNNQLSQSRNLTYKRYSKKEVLSSQKSGTLQGIHQTLFLQQIHKSVWRILLRWMQREQEQFQVTQEVQQSMPL